MGLPVKLYRINGGMLVGTKGLLSGDNIRLEDFTDGIFGIQPINGTGAKIYVPRTKVDNTIKPAVTITEDKQVFIHDPQSVKLI